MLDVRGHKVQKVVTSSSTVAGNFASGIGQNTAVFSALAMLFQALGTKGSELACQPMASNLDNMQVALVGGSSVAGGISVATTLWCCLLTVVIGLAFDIWLTRKIRQEQPEVTTTRTDVTQSMTTYCWRYSEPRFKFQVDDGSHHVTMGRGAQRC